MIRRPPRSTRTDTLFPYPTLFRSLLIIGAALRQQASRGPDTVSGGKQHAVDDVDHAVRLKNVGGADLGRAALGVAHIPAAILLPDGELGALPRGEPGLARSEARRGGKECVRTCRSRGSPYS